MIHSHPLHAIYLRSPHVLTTSMTRSPNCHYSTLTFCFILQCLFTYKFNPFLNFVIYHLLSPYPLISPAHLPSPNTSGTLRLFYFSPTTSRLTQLGNQLIKTQCFAAYVPTKPTVELNRIWHPPAPPRIAMQNAIKHVLVYLFTEHVMLKTLVTL